MPDQEPGSEGQDRESYTDVIDVEGEEVGPEPTGLVPIMTQSVVMTVESARAQADLLREMTAAVLKPDVDYGVIPGTKKPSLYKAGAEWLLKWFGLGHHFEQISVDTERDTDRPYGITYRCLVTRLLPDGQTTIISTCDGYASRDESKWAKAPWNTVMKMAQKRALVGATLQATGTSGHFTQDMEDMDRSDAPGTYVEKDVRYAELLGIVVDRIASLDEPQKKALRVWWDLNGYPATASCSPMQLAEGMLTLGAILAGQEAVLPKVTGPQHRRLMALLTEMNLNNDDDRHAMVKQVTQGRSESSLDLTPDEANILYAQVKGESS